MRFGGLCFVLLGLVLASSLGGRAEITVPIFRTLDGANYGIINKPPEKITFLLASEPPPLGYLGPKGELRGFNQDLVKALCAELDSDCLIKAKPQATLLAALEAGVGDVALADFQQGSKIGAPFDHSKPYLKGAARFVARKAQADPKIIQKGFEGHTIGVLADSPHERFLVDYFPKADRKSYPTEAALRQSIVDRKVSHIFTDGLSTSFWLLDEVGERCCQFVGGPYLESHYFGRGLVFVLPKSEGLLRQQIDIAISRLQKKGKFTELYLKHFPLNFFQ